MRTIAIPHPEGVIIVLVDTAGSAIAGELVRVPPMPPEAIEAAIAGITPLPSEWPEPGTLQEKRERSRAAMPRPARCVQRTGLPWRTPAPDARAAAARRSSARG